MSLGAALLALAVTLAPGDIDPGTSWASDVAKAGGTVRVEAQRGAPASVSGPYGRRPRLVTRVWYMESCHVGTALIGASGSCETDLCETADGRPGIRKYRMHQLEDVVEGTSVGPVHVSNPVCVAVPPPAGELERLILRAFRDLALPGVTVRTRPDGMTLVNWPTTFRARRGWSEHGLGRILGHRVRVEIRPVRYEWAFGDGATRRTRPLASVAHTYGNPGAVATSVTATYRARYRVDGGSPRRIPGTATVPGPATALDVRSARTQLVAGPR